ncbi:MAG: hypothetical protein GY710_02095 [Desulfobacteraceae bacterium]|nr:hypothetical protein [Desulfobacteraceae bacterium]
MLLRLEIDHETKEIFADIIDADCASGIVLPYNYTDDDIVEYCINKLCEPECGWAEYEIKRLFI